MRTTLRHWRHVLPLLAGLALAAAGSAAAADPKAAPPAKAPELPWVWPAPTPLRVLQVRGLWTAYYRLEEGLARAGGAVVDTSYVWDGIGAGWPGDGLDQGNGGLTAFPAAAGLMQHQVVIVSNVNAKAFGANERVLMEFVRQGGGVLILGGRFALGEQVQNSPFSEWLPVTLPATGGPGLHEVPAGLPITLAPGGADLPLAQLPWDAKPLVYWYHELTPKAGAQVRLLAGDHPLLVTGTFGKGRVAVFAGTVLGDPPADAPAFWTWAGWPGVLSATVQWLAAGSAAAPRGLDEATRAALATTLTAQAGSGTELDAGAATAETPPAVGALLLAAAQHAHDRDTVHWLLARCQALPGDLPAGLPALIGEAARPFADAASAQVGTALLASGLPYKTALGLRLLGASPDPAAIATLAAFLKSGEPRAPAAGHGDDPLTHGMEAGSAMKAVLPAEQARQALAIRLGALAGLGGHGAAALPALRAALAAATPTGKPRPTEYADVLTDDQRLYQGALLANLRAGDPAAAPLLVDALLEDIYILARDRSERNKSKDKLQRLQAEEAALAVWIDEYLQCLPTLPDAVLPAFATRCAAEGDPRVARLALAAFAGRAGTPAAKPLARSAIPAVAALAPP